MSSSDTTRQIFSTPKILLYHGVSDSFNLLLTNVRKAQFEKHIQSIVASGFECVTLSEWYVSSGNHIKCVITFDDALDTVYEHAFPILQKYGIPSTLFVVTGYINRKNSWDIQWGGNARTHMRSSQLVEMAKYGHEIASHSHSHVPLIYQDKKDIHQELGYSKKRLQDLTGQECRFIAYPYGLYNRDILQLSKSIGYLAGIGVLPGVVHDSYNSGEFQILYRYPVYRFNTTSSIITYMNTHQKTWTDRITHRLIASISSAVIYYRQLSGNKYRGE